MHFSLDSPSRRKSVKILAIGNYAMLVLDIIQGLAFVPLFIHYLGDRLYGLWLGTGGILAVLSFLDLGMASLNIQRVAREYGKKNYIGIGKYFFNGMIISSAFMTILFFFGLIISYKLNVFFEITNEEFLLLSDAFLIAIISIILQLQNNVVEGTLNALQKPLFGKISAIIANILGIIVTYILLVHKFSVLAIPIGLLVRSGTALLPNFMFLLLLFIKNRIKIISFDKNIIKDYLSLTPSIFLSKFGTSLVGNIEPTLITMFVSPQIAVYFSVTKKAAGLLRTILDRVGGILFPSFAHLYAENNVVKLKTLFEQLIKSLIPVSIAFFALYFLLNKLFVNLWVGSEYYLGDLITLLISFSLLLSFYSNVTSYLLGSTGDIKYPSFLIFLESIIKVLLLYFLLLIFGIYGLPIAVIIASFLFLIKYINRWNIHLKFSYSDIIALLKIVLKNSTLIITTIGLSYFLIKVNNEYNNLTAILIYSTALLIIAAMVVFQNKKYIPYINK